MGVLGIVASDELVEVFALQRIFFEGKMLVGAQVVDLKVLRPGAKRPAGLHSSSNKVVLSGRGEEIVDLAKVIARRKRLRRSRRAGLTGYLISIESCIQREHGERLQPPCHLRPLQQHNA